MATHPRPDSGRNSNAFARRRDAMVLWLLQRHPATASALVEAGLFPKMKKASKRLHRLLERHQVRRLGTVSLKDGRPEHVYGRGSCKGDNLAHEVQLTRLCLKIHADEVRRGPGDVDPHLLPDAELTINGERFFLEFDCGTMPYEAVLRKRFSKYRSSRDFVLWVCASDTQMEGLRARAGMLRETALFTTIDLALGNPHGPIWRDVEGETVALPRGGKGGRNPGEKGGAEGGTFAPPASGEAATPVMADASRTVAGTIGDTSPLASRGGGADSRLR